MHPAQLGPDMPEDKHCHGWQPHVWTQLAHMSSMASTLLARDCLDVCCGMLVKRCRAAAAGNAHTAGTFDKAFCKQQCGVPDSAWRLCDHPLAMTLWADAHKALHMPDTASRIRELGTIPSLTVCCLCSSTRSQENISDPRDHGVTGAAS